jgi:hypothetical protein
MNSISYVDTKSNPLRTDADIADRVDNLVGHALKRQLWVLFLDDQNLQRELVIPIDDLPVAPDQTVVDYLVTALGEVVKMHGGGSLIFVRERPGSEILDRTDLEWAGALTSACERGAVALRGLLLSHDGGVCWARGEL